MSTEQIYKLSIPEKCGGKGPGIWANEANPLKQKSSQNLVNVSSLKFIKINKNSTLSHLLSLSFSSKSKGGGFYMEGFFIFIFIFKIGLFMTGVI